MDCTFQNFSFSFQVVDDHAGEVRHAAFSPDGNWLATCGLDAQVAQVNITKN